jgi:hypothetical protein
MRYSSAMAPQCRDPRDRPRERWPALKADDASGPCHRRGAARVWPATDGDADLSPAEEALHIGARKTVYEKLHPETKHGGAPGKTGGGKEAKDLKVGSFVQHTAEQTGKGRRTVARSSTRAKKIAPAVLATVAGTTIDKGDELDALAKLPEIGGTAKRENLAERTRLDQLELAHRRLHFLTH